MLSAIILSLASSGCGGLRQPKIVVEDDAFIHITDKETTTKSPAVERKGDPTQLDIVDGRVEIPIGYVCAPPEVFE